MPRIKDGSVSIEARIDTGKLKTDAAQAEKIAQGAGAGVAEGFERGAKGTDALADSLKNAISVLADANSSTEAVRSVLENLSSALHAVFNQSIEARNLTEVFDSVSSGAETAGESLTENLSENLNGVIGDLTRVGRAADETGSNFRAFAGSIVSAGVFGLITAAVNLLGSGIAHLVEQMMEGTEIAEEYHSAVDDLARSYEDAAEKAGLLADGQREVMVNMSTKALEKHAETLGDVREELSKLTDFDLDRVGDFDEIFNNVDILRAFNLLQDGIISFEDLFKTLSRIQNGMKAAGKGTKEFHDKFDELLKKVKGGVGAESLYNKEAEKLKNLKNEAGSAVTALTKLDNSIDKLRKRVELQEIGEADSVLQSFSRSTALAAKRAEENRAAQIREARAIYGKQIALQNAAGAMAGAAAMDLQAAGEAERAAALFRTAAKHYADAKFLADRLKNFDELIASGPATKSGGGGSAFIEKTSDVISRLRREFEALRKTGQGEFGRNLEEGLKRINDELTRTKAGTAVIKAMQNEFREAFATDAISKFNRELAELEGRGFENAIDDLAKAVSDAKDAFGVAGLSAEEATGKIQRFFNATMKEIETDGLEKLSELAKGYGKDLESQNALLEEMVALLGSKLPDAMKPLINKWKEWKEAQGDESGSDKKIKDNAIDDYVKKWTDAEKVIQENTRATVDLVEGVGRGAVDAIFGDADFRLDKLFKNLAKQLANIAMNQVFASVLKGLFGIGGPTLPGHMSGGYTGSAPINKVTGVVHGQEYVLNAATTKSIGVSTLDAINSGKLKLASFASTSNLPHSGSLAVGAAVVQPIIEFKFEDHTKGGVDAKPTPAVNSGGDPSRWVINVVAQDMAAGGRTNRATREAFGLKNIPR